MLANLKSSADLGVVRKVGWRLPVLQSQSCIVLDKRLHFSELLKMEILHRPIMRTK